MTGSTWLTTIQVDTPPFCGPSRGSVLETVDYTVCAPRGVEPNVGFSHFEDKSTYSLEMIRKISYAKVKVSIHMDGSNLRKAQHKLGYRLKNILLPLLINIKQIINYVCLKN